MLCLPRAWAGLIQPTYLPACLTLQVLLNEEDPLGVSLGYKAADAAVRAYDQSWESLTT